MAGCKVPKLSNSSNSFTLSNSPKSNISNLSKEKTGINDEPTLQQPPIVFRVGKILHDVLKNDRLHIRWVAKGAIFILVIQNITKTTIAYRIALQNPNEIIAKDSRFPSTGNKLESGDALWIREEIVLDKEKSNYLPTYSFKCKLFTVTEGNNDQQEVDFMIPMTIFGFVKQGKMSTKEFAKQWQKGGSEKGAKITNNMTLNTISQKFEEILNLTKIQRIKEEEIFIGMLEKEMILVHVKRAAKIQIKVLTQSEELSQACLEALVQIIS